MVPSTVGFHDGILDGNDGGWMILQEREGNENDWMKNEVLWGPLMDPLGM